jgi:hypothetical protein
MMKQAHDTEWWSGGAVTEDRVGYEVRRVNFSAIDAAGQARSGITRFITVNADLIRRCSDLHTVIGAQPDFATGRHQALIANLKQFDTAAELEIAQ